MMPAGLPSRTSGRGVGGGHTFTNRAVPAASTAGEASGQSIGKYGGGLDSPPFLSLCAGYSSDAPKGDASPGDVEAPRKSTHVEDVPTVRKGLLIVFTGNGKGKTTAALGMTLRAAGHGMRTLILQFIKGSWPSGEIRALEGIDDIMIRQLGSGFTWKKEDREEDRRLAEAGWELAADAIRRAEYDMIVLDELNYVLSYELLALDPVLEVLRNRPENLHVVVTGRNAPGRLLDLADLATEMRAIKHPYHDRGVKAQEGVEY